MDLCSSVLLDKVYFKMYNIKNQDMGYEKFKEMITNFVSEKFGDSLEVDFSQFENDNFENNKNNDEDDLNG